MRWHSEKCIDDENTFRHLVDSNEALIICLKMIVWFSKFVFEKALLLLNAL